MIVVGPGPFNSVADLDANRAGTKDGAALPDGDIVVAAGVRAGRKMAKKASSRRCISGELLRYFRGAR